jgi:hypothetical protein
MLIASGPLAPVARFETHLRTLVEALKAVVGDVGVMNEKILRVVVRGDEAILGWDLGEKGLLSWGFAWWGVVGLNH